MKKKLLLKFGLIAFSLWLFCPFYTSAALVSINLTGLQQVVALNPAEAAKKMMNVHFADNWNDFGGFLYFSNDINDIEDLMDTGAVLFPVITEWNEGEIYKCRTPVKWFYYNAQRWERLWPLDSETWSGLDQMSGLVTTWWIFTICAKSGYQEAMQNCINDDNYQDCVSTVKSDYKADGFGYYWFLEQEYKTWKYTLTIWVNYDTGTDFISAVSGSELAPTFVRVENKYPVWFIYDKNWWLGLAWCQFDSESLTNHSMKNLYSEVFSGGWLSKFFMYSGGLKNLVYSGSVEWITCGDTSFANMLVKILIEWIMWLTDYGPESSVKFWTLGNSNDTKMQYFWTNTVSNTTMMNYVKKKAEQLCRWKWKSDDFSSVSDKIICWDWWDLGTWSSNWAKQYGKTLIVKNANVVVSPITGAFDSKYHDIFILSGDLLIDETDAKEFVINKKGFILDNGIINQNNVANYFRIRNFINIYEEVIDANDLRSKIRDCILGLQDFQVWMDADWDNNCDDVDENLVIYYWLQNFELVAPEITAVASAIKWNFIVNWHVKSASGEGETLNNKYFLYGKFTAKDTFNELEKVFAWRCDNGITKDRRNFCPKTNYIDEDDETPYRNASLVVIDQNYPSPMFQS